MVVAVWLMALPAQADNEFFQRGNWQDPGIETRITMQPVQVGDLAGELYLPPNANHLPALLALEACTKPALRGLAQGMADHGYATLALFYCGVDTSRPQLQEIPLEIFKTALDWLRAQPSVDPDRVGIIGASAGAAAGLLAAARDPRVKAVVAVVPGNVVWQAPIAGGEPKSMFSLGGKPLPFLPGDISLPTEARLTFARNSLLSQGINPRAIIPVEKIRAPILLISGKDDLSWPSSLMAEQIVARLKESKFSHPYENLSYADAGHGFFAAHDSEDPWFAELYPRLMTSAIDKQLGGTTAGNSTAQKDSWPKTLSFLQKYL